jgi:hypothetical protein
MSRIRIRAFGFDSLEARELLAASHQAARPHSTPMIAETPLVLSGTLAVENNLTSSVPNADGSTTTSTPLAGNLGSLGRVTGVWNESLDSFGDASGLNVLRLQTGKGSLVITFSTVNTVKTHPAGHGEVFYTRAQKLFAGTGAYAGAKESGMLDLTTNPGRSAIASVTLKSANS